MTVEVRGVVALDAGPPRVVCAARRVVDQRLLERRHVPERHLNALPRGRPEELPQIAHVVPDVLLLAGIVRDLLRVLRVDKECPEHLPMHRAALARAVRVVARRDDVRPDRGEVRRPFDRRANLHLPGVGAADGTDPAIRPRLLRDPLHDVVPIAARVWRSGIEVGAGALRAVAVAHVDEHHDVSTGHEEVGDLDVPVRRLVVRGVTHDRGEPPAGKRAVGPG